LIVVDASLFVAWLLNEPEHVPANDIFDLLATEKIVVPAHWPVEVASALRKAIQTGRLALDELDPLVQGFSVFDLAIANPVPQDQIGVIANFALKNGLTAYDAIYVQLAIAQNAPLATFDIKMRNAADQLAVSVLPA
jgi:predicted nucleic acid-binding protein